MQTFQLRPHQADGITAALGNAAGEATILNLAPGAGKTISALSILDAFWKENEIDGAAVFVPRLGLATQFELDWLDIRHHFGKYAMGQIVHKNNGNLGLELNQSGYVTSYASLVSDPQSHIDFAKRRGGRFALVLDEAHFLGTGDRRTAPTKAAAVLERLGKYARGIVLMTGTPYRADGNPLAFGRYDCGILDADVTVGYGDGVRQGFLRPLEAVLLEADVTVDYDGQQIVESSSTQIGGMSKVSINRKFWVPLVSAFVEKITEFQELDPRYCGIASCANKNHARQVHDYLLAHGVKSILAISDDSSSHENMLKFKAGGYDVLVTVAMASIGFDHKPVICVAALGGFREFAWLDQFVMRAGRMWPDRPRDEQTMQLFGMDDVLMRRYVSDKKSEIQRGLKFKPDDEEEENKKRKPSLDPEQGTKRYVVDVEVAGAQALSHDNRVITIDVSAYVGEGLTNLQSKKEVSAEIKKRVGQLAYKRCRGNGMGDEIRAIYSEMKSFHGGKSVTKCSLEELVARLQWVERQLGIAPKPVQRAIPIVAEVEPVPSGMVQKTLF